MGKPTLPADLRFETAGLSATKTAPLALLEAELVAHSPISPVVRAACKWASAHRLLPVSEVREEGIMPPTRFSLLLAVRQLEKHPRNT